jgi:hypothetical protein
MTAYRGKQRKIRGPSDAQRCRGAGGRNRLVQRAPQGALRQPLARPAKEPSGRGQVGEGASRRAVKQPGEEREAAARALKVAAPWMGWDNPPGGGSMWQYAPLGTGRGLHIRETPQRAGA